MKTIVQFFIIVFFAYGCSEKPFVKVTHLRCEYKVNPLGVDIAKPRFGWVSESNRRVVMQTAYQIIVSSNRKNLDDNVPDIWDSQKVSSDQSIQIAYNGKPLESNRTYFWKVKIWDQNNQPYTSDSAFWTTGLLHESDWKAKWIGLDRAVGTDDPQKLHPVLSARMLRHEFTLEKKVKRATAFISGLGLFEFYLNGEKIGDQVLAPGLTQYNKRAFYQTFDVTRYLLVNNNAIGVMLGNGRFFGPRAGANEQTVTFGFPKMICQLEVQYEDGTSKTIVSDESWKLTADGPVRNNNEYDGERYDARMELENWNKTGYNDATWLNAQLVEKPCEKLVAQPNEPIRIMDEISPVSMKKIGPDTFIFDMGQNMVGWVELSVKGKKGDKVALRFAETLKADSSLFVANLRTAEVTDTYILRGEGEEKWQPRFTYHGFRYVEMTGYPGTPTRSSIRGKVIHDALDVAGSFACSNPLINRIYKNACWGVRGNYRSMPTDCPQRDERQGWLGDRSAECTGESYLFNISSLYNKWVTDMNDAQLPNGSLPDVAPAYWPLYSDNTTWPGTFLFASDMLYTQYGDKRIIEANYPAMQKWVDHMSQYVKNGIMIRDTYGDWCVPPEDLKLINSSDPLRITSADFIGTAYFQYELNLMKKFALLLGKEKDAETYSTNAEEMKVAFNQHFLDKKEVRYSNNTCTANILALAMGLVPAEYKDKITDNLLQKILSENAGHVGNGIVGGQWLMRTLTSTGHPDVAYTLASQNTYPGWGYMVEHGATTIWELWNGDHGDPGMNSGNHVMLLGDLIIWYYENLAGIKADPDMPAFKHVIMKPVVPGGLTNVDASYESVYGKITSKWKNETNKFTWEITIPANTSATVYIPTIGKEEVNEGHGHASKAEGVQFVRWEGNLAVFEIKSGSYSFSSGGVKKTVTVPFVSSPVILPYDTLLVMGSKANITITCVDKDAVIRYTTDGNDVTETSPVYSKPVEISTNTILKAQSFQKGYHSSNQVKVNYSFINPEKNGIQWSFYKGTVKQLPDFSHLTPASKGTIYQFGLKKLNLPEGSFALQFASFVQIDKEGEYTFYIASNDGSKLYVDGNLLIDNGGEHGTKELSNSLFLKKGRHALKADYFQSGGNKSLMVSYSSADIRYQPIPEFCLFKSKN
jgi:alpha-L-rhamnosidase